MEQLKKLLLIMLSSDQPGEITAAAGKVQKWLKKNDKDIHWLVDQLVSGKAPAPMPKPTEYGAPGMDPMNPWGNPRSRPAGNPWGQYKPPPVDWQAMLILCADCRSYLKSKEEDFIGSLLDQSTTHRSWHPTERQLDWLTAIYTRLKNMGF